MGERERDIVLTSVYVYIVAGTTWFSTTPVTPLKLSQE